MPEPRPVIVTLQRAGAALVALWTADVVAQLDLLHRAVHGDPLPSRWTDFLAMALMLAPVALGLAVGAAVAAPISARLGRRGDIGAERIALLGAGLAAFLMFGSSRLAGVFPTSARGLASVVAVAVGGGVWLLGRRQLTRHPGLQRSPAALGLLVSLGLGVCLANRTVAAVGLGGSSRALVAGIAATLSFALLVWIARRGEPIAGRLALVPTTLALALAAGTLVSSSGYGRVDLGTRTATADRRPDIVLVVLDTVRADHLELYGYGRQTMPQLNSWARQALVARRAVSTGGWTSPSHASMLSGLPVSLHGVHYTRAAGSALSTPARDGLAWLPAQVGRHGYVAVAVTANPFAITPGIEGFDQLLERTRFSWESGTIASKLDRLPGLTRWSERLRWRMPYIDAAGITDAVTRLAAPERPLFLFVNYLDAHSPYNPPAGGLQALELEPGRSFPRYRSHRELTQGWSGLPATAAADLRDLYDGELRALDQQLGRLLAWIDETLGTDTVVVITSDHGEELGEEGRVGHEYGLPQSVLWVPLLVRAPRLPPGDVTQPVAVRRVHDLILAVASGRNASAEELRGDDGFGVIAERYPSGHNIRSVGDAASRPWVALIEGLAKGTGPTHHGFVLEDVDDFAAARLSPESAAGDSLAQRIDAYWEAHQDRREDEVAERSPEELEQLRSLGYVQ